MHTQAPHAPATPGKPETQDNPAASLEMRRRRLFMQLQVFTGCADAGALKDSLAKSGLESVLYLDVQNPAGVGVLFLAESPEYFVKEVRALLGKAPWTSLTRLPDMMLFGATYLTGREPEPDDYLLQRPRRIAFNAETPWAVWYPLRRKSEFALLSREEQGKILMEHGMLGRAYGEAGLVSDIRLSCFGLDTHDNEFVLGLIGADLYPLSSLVQEMRKTQQTAKYMQSLGPFFVGKVF